MLEENTLLLLSGNDIPFVGAQTTIHQPTIKEIAFIGERDFFTGAQMLNFSKKILLVKDKNDLDDYNDFDIFIAILKEQNAVMRKNRDCVLKVLNLIFPNFDISINKDYIELKKEDEVHMIDNNNFKEFKEIIVNIFGLNLNDSTTNNVVGKKANEIAEKLKKRHEKLAEIKGPEKIDIIARYVSILAAGESKDMNCLLNYTYFQLLDEFERYRLKSNYDIYISAKMAGASGMEDVEDWMCDVHSIEYIQQQKLKNK